jgi:hypothetical protein
MLPRGWHERQAAEQHRSLDETQRGRGTRELEILVASGAELAQNDIMQLHAVRDNFSDGHIYGARLPSARRVSRGLEGDALCVIAIFDIEGTSFADDEGDSIGHAFIAVWWNDIDIASSCEDTFRRIRKHRQYCGRTYDEDFCQSEALPDFKNDVLQLNAAHDA